MRPGVIIVRRLIPQLFKLRISRIIPTGSVFDFSAQSLGGLLIMVFQRCGSWSLIVLISLFVSKLLMASFLRFQIRGTSPSRDSLA